MIRNSEDVRKVAMLGSIIAENRIESSSDSDSDTDISVEICSALKRAKMGNFYKRKAVRIRLYIEEVVPNYNGKEFQSHFRVTREAFEALLYKIGTKLRRQGNVGRFTICPEKQILSVLWLLATPDSFRSVGERFDMGKSSLSTSFFRVVKAINGISSLIITWPKQLNDLQETERSFRNMARIPFVIGAVDGTYIPIKAPSQDPEVYITRKCHHAITLQAICIGNLKFSDVFVGYPGSVSDTRIFKNSDIFRHVQQNPDTFFPNNQYILGDKAYPTLEWCIPPYINRGNLTAAQTLFNTKHAQTRQTIERAFALLFGRFRRLKFVDMNVFEMIPHTVLAACVLHNICLEHDDLLINEYILEGEEQLAHNDEVDVTVIAQEELVVGKRKRDQLCEYIYNIYN